MEFAFTEEQKMIRDTAEAFLAGASTSEAVRSAMVTEFGYDESLWQRICGELYWQAIHIPESYGGLGLGYVELVSTLEQMGRYLLCSPYFATVGLAANAILVAGNEEQKTEYLGKIATGGTATLAFAGKPSARSGGQWGAEAVDLIAEARGDGYVLNGSQYYVVDGVSAQTLVVAARLSNTQGEEGICLFALPADSAGIERETLPTMDQTRKQARITYTDMVVPRSALMGEAGQAWPLLARTLDLANIRPGC